MKCVQFEDVATVTYVLIDDLYQAEGKQLLKAASGKIPVFSNSEVLTLPLLVNFLPDPAGQYLGFVRSNYLSLFPKRLDQSRFNR